MAKRPVFSARSYYPYFEEIHVEMDWFQGFALSQKRRSECSLHQNYLASYPDEKLLEVSSASTNPLGYWLSAMHLRRGDTCVESEFQSSRIYKATSGEMIGPFPEYRMLSGKECKKKVKEAAGKLHSYTYACGGYHIPAPDYHISLFYDYVYISALLEEQNRKLRNLLLDGQYTAFSDLATKSLNSQARSCAIFVGLAQAGLLDKIHSIEDYMEIMRTGLDGKALAGAYKHTQPFNTKSDRVLLLHPVVPLTFTKEEAMKYFEEHYSSLSNSKKYIPELEG